MTLRRFIGGSKMQAHWDSTRRSKRWPHRLENAPTLGTDRSSSPSPCRSACYGLIPFFLGGRHKTMRLFDKQPTGNRKQKLDLQFHSILGHPADCRAKGRGHHGFTLSPCLLLNAQTLSIKASSRAREFVVTGLSPGWEGINNRKA